MQKLYVSQWLMAGAVGLLFSCQPNNETTVAPVTSSQETSAQITLSGDRLKFASTTDFMNTIKSLNTSDGLKNWEKRFPGFTSLDKSYTNLVKYDIGKALEDGTIKQYEGVYIITGQGDSREYKRAVTDPTLANVVNSKGLVQIGDSLLRVSDIAVSRTHLRYEQELLQGNGTHVISKAVTNMPITIKALSGARLASVDDYWEIYYNASGLVQRRFKGNNWAKNYWFPQLYWSTGVTVSHQRNNWWGWGSHPSDGMSVSGSATWDNNPLSVWYKEQNSETIQWGHWETGWGSSHVGTINMNATFTGIANGDGGNGGKTKSWSFGFSTSI